MSSVAKRPRREGNLSTRRLSDEETVVLAPNGSAVILNEVGAVVLDLCDGTRTIDDVVRILCESLQGSSEERVRADVAAFVKTLTDAGCLVESS